MSLDNAPRWRQARKRLAAPLALLPAAIAMPHAHAAQATPAQPPAVEASAHVSPVVSSVTVLQDARNALAVSLRADVTGADSARLIYRVNGRAPQTTPYHAVRGPTVTVPLLGLPPLATVTVRVEAMRGGRTSLTDEVPVRTGDLPWALADVSLRTLRGQPSPGLILTEVIERDTTYAVAFDSSGRIVWYHTLGHGTSVGDVQQQPNGHITAWVGHTNGFAPNAEGRFLEIDPAVGVVRQYRAPDGYFTDNHELVLDVRDDSVHAAYLFGYDRRATTRKVDDSPDGKLAGHQLLRIALDGRVTVVVDGWTQFSVDDAPGRTFPEGDVDHPNSLEVDAAGDLLVSWRTFSEVAKYDGATGAVLWRLGGPHGQLRVVDDPLSGFAYQHFARTLPNGDILLYDNGDEDRRAGSRVAQYRVDTAAGTATLVWQYQPAERTFTRYVGSVQRLENGHTLVGFAHARRVHEVDASGSVVWEAEVDGLPRGGVSLYRLLRIASLYEYRAP